MSPPVLGTDQQGKGTWNWLPRRERSRCCPHGPFGREGELAPKGDRPGRLAWLGLKEEGERAGEVAVVRVDEAGAGASFFFDDE